MGEEKKEYTVALKKILKPDRWKIVVFSLLIVLMFFIPMYPTKVATYSGLPSPTEPEETHNALSALIFLIITDFHYEHTEEGSRLVHYPDGYPDITTPPPPIYPFTVYEASPTFLIVYIFLIPLFYILGCYAVEIIRWKKKFVYEKGVKEL